MATPRSLNVKMGCFFYLLVSVRLQYLLNFSQIEKPKRNNLVKLIFLCAPYNAIVEKLYFGFEKIKKIKQQIEKYNLDPVASVENCICLLTLFGRSLPCRQREHFISDFTYSNNVYKIYFSYFD